MNGQESAQTAASRGGLCLDHENRITRNAEDIAKVDAETDKLHNKREKAVGGAHKRIDHLWWCIAGAMFAVSIEAVLVIVMLLRNSPN